VYDDFDDDDRRSWTRRRPPTWQIVVLAIGAGLLVIGGAAAIVSHHRVAHSNRLAVKYGLATSTKQVSLVARCTAALRDEYDTASAPARAVIPPGAWTVLAPNICALGVQEGVVRQDGTMTRQDGEKVAVATFERMGQARVQTMMFNELAVTPYRLAKPGHVTRWDRCLAMGYSAYDGLSAEMKSDLPTRARFFRAVRSACTNGIARGLVPPSGAPSQHDTSLLLAEALASTK
jgi:hypothetical protein